MTVARICQDIRERDRACCERDFSAHDLVYCYLDAIDLKAAPDRRARRGRPGRLGLTLEGQKVLLGLQLGSRESYDCWLEFGRDLTACGMRAPALIISDGAAGIWKATSRGRPHDHTQRPTAEVIAANLASQRSYVHTSSPGTWDATPARGRPLLRASSSPARRC